MSCLPAALSATGTEASGLTEDLVTHSVLPPQAAWLPLLELTSSLRMSHALLSTLPTCTPFSFEQFKYLFSDKKEGPVAELLA